MRIFSSVLVGLYAALNVFLAIVGMVGRDASVPVARAAVPCLLFLLAGVVLALSVVRHDRRLMVVGLVLASIAPVAFGAMVEGTNVLLHHAVRAVVALMIGLLAWRSWGPVAQQNGVRGRA